MKRNVIIPSIISIIILLLLSFNQAIGYQSLSRIPTTTSPLFHMRSQRAIKTNTLQVTPTFLASEKTVDLPIPSYKNSINNDFFIQILLFLEKQYRQESPNTHNIQQILNDNLSTQITHILNIYKNNTQNKQFEINQIANAGILSQGTTIIPKNQKSSPLLEVIHNSINDLTQLNIKKNTASGILSWLLEFLVWLIEKIDDYLTENLYYHPILYIILFIIFFILEIFFWEPSTMCISTCGYCSYTGFIK